MTHTEDKIPPRWDFEVRVMTPDHRVITKRVSQPPDYMDASLFEYITTDLVDEIARELKEHFN